MQRNKFSDTLLWMEHNGFLSDGDPLLGFGHALTQVDPISGKFLVPLQTTDCASLHSGAFTVKVFKGREGYRQDFHTFIVFDGEGGTQELCVFRIEAIAKGQLAEDADTIRKLAYGKIATCKAVAGLGLNDSYSNGPDTNQPDRVHRLPTIVTPVQTTYADTVWYPYVIELKNIQATILEGKTLDGHAVFVPYVPMSSHG